MLASTGTWTASAKRRYVARSLAASAKMPSAPASAHRIARSIARSTPSTAIESVRAIRKKSESVFASAAALTRSAISPALTISLPGRWPQRLAPTWSSIWHAAAPALISALTVRAILNALGPKPVSMSTSSGRLQTSVIRRTSINTSSSVLMPRSGIPSEPAATPPPDR